jgi:hypothetical protein
MKDKTQVFLAAQGDLDRGIEGLGDLDHLARHDESAWIAEREEFLLY